MRVLLILVPLVLLVYCLIDCIQTDESLVRNLPKMAWILIIIFVSVVGPIAWLVAGRPAREQRRNVAWPSGATSGFPEYERPRIKGPDDDPDFLRSMRKADDNHEAMLRKWEEDLRKREEGLRDEGGENDPQKENGQKENGQKDDEQK